MLQNFKQTPENKDNRNILSQKYQVGNFSPLELLQNLSLDKYCQD